MANHFRTMEEGKYADTFTCPGCQAVRQVIRWITSAGRKVNSYCDQCGQTYSVVAGPIAGEVDAKQRCDDSGA